MSDDRFCRRSTEKKYDESDVGAAVFVVLFTIAMLVSSVGGCVGDAKNNDILKTIRDKTDRIERTVDAINLNLVKEKR